MDPFRQVFLHQVRLVVEKNAGAETLYELLKIATPALKRQDIFREPCRKKAFKTLQLRIHPDKHPKSDTTELYQNVQAFYSEACHSLSKPSEHPKRSPPSTNSKYPTHFHVQDKWPFLDNHSIKPPLKKSIKESELSALMAARCINARGAIAHNAKTELYFSIEAMSVHADVQSAFDYNGGTKHLSTIDSIKEELMQNGPVVSTSFTLPQSFLSAGEYSCLLLRSRTSKKHELLILGWKLTSFGEVWLVGALNGQVDPIRIAFGQFGIDTTCLAPVNTFENMKWQSGPSLDISLGVFDESNDWMGFKDLWVEISRLELEDLSKCFEFGLLSAFKENESFLIRDKKKKAHSRRYFLKELNWNQAAERWTLSVVKTANTKGH